MTMRWKIDPAHSSLTFGVRHMMVTTVRGSLSGLAGTLEYDPERPESAAIELTADARTITTGETRRDGHLRSADFFDADKFPEVRFRSTALVPKRGADDRFEVHGDLTMHGITRSVTAEAELGGIADDAKGGKRAGFRASVAIDRREWGLVWNQPLANGGVLVGEKVKVELDLAAVSAAEATEGTKAA